MQISKENVTKGLFWTYAERLCAQLVSLVVSVILARILDPEHYGIIALVLIFITLLNAFVTGGFGNALIQKRNSDDLDFNSIFYMGLALSTILYLIMFFAAPLISSLYNLEVLTPVIRIMSLKLPLSSINTIQHAYIQKNMQFRKFFVSTIVGTIISAAIGIIMAYNGSGVWALVAQYMSNSLIDTIILFFTCGWKPRFMFSKQRVKEMFPFGVKMLLSTLTFTVVGEIRSLVISVKYSTSDLGYYNQGVKYPNFIVTNINSSIGKVLFPTLSQAQADIDRLKQMMRRSIRVGSFILLPILLGFFSVSTNFVSVVLTDKWMPCVVFLQITCIMYIFRPFESAIQQSLLAIGKSGLNLKMELFSNLASITMIILAVFVFNSIILIACSALLAELVSFIVFNYYSSKYLGYTAKEKFADMSNIYLSGALMCGAVFLINFLPIGNGIKLAIQIPIGIILYFVFCLLFKVDSLVYVKNILKGIFKRKSNA